MSGQELSDLQDSLARLCIEHGPQVLAQALSDELDHDDRCALLMVNIMQRAQDLEQANA